MPAPCRSPSHDGVRVTHAPDVVKHLQALMNRSVGEARPQLWTIPSAKDAAYAEMANVVPFHVLPKAPEEVWVANRGASSLELSGGRGRQRDLRLS